MSELSKKPNYRADIQGLRGIAVLLVVIYHAGLPLFGGFIGVDVFFVLSGFVISDGMLRALGRGRFSFKDFYVKRVRRLLPALAVMLSTVMAMMFWLGPVISRVFTVRTGVAAALLNANHYLIRGPSYFDPSTEYNALLHTWSLSVEEQFYLVFPLVLFLLWRVGGEQGRSRRLLFGVSALSIVSFGLCVWWSYSAHVFGFEGVRVAFYTALTRSWQFGAGVLIALAAPRLARSVLARDWSGWLGVGMVLLAAMIFDKDTVFPGYAALLPTIGTALAMIAGMSQSRRPSVTRALEFRPLVRIGDLSYSWYLWHWPLIVFAAANFPHRPLEASVSAAFLSLGVAWLSERWVENPIRYRAPDKRQPILQVAALSMLLPVAIFGLQEVFARHVIQDARQAEVERGLVQESLIAKEEYNAIGCDFAFSSARAKACEWGNPDSKRMLLVGDSNARHHIPVLRELVPELGWHLTARTFSECPFAELYVQRNGSPMTRCREWYEAMRDEVLTGQYDVVLMASSTDGYVVNPKYKLSRASEPPVVSPEDKAQRMVAAVRELADKVTQSGSQVILVDPIPKFEKFKKRSWAEEFRYTRASALALRCSLLSLHLAPERCNISKDPTDVPPVVAELGERIQRDAASDTLLRVQLSSALCPNGQCDVVDVPKGRIIYGDMGHIYPHGSRMTAEAFRQVLRQVNTH